MGRKRAVVKARNEAEFSRWITVYQRLQEKRENAEMAKKRQKTPANP